jgi:hypothetical protein
MTFSELVVRSIAAMLFAAMLTGGAKAQTLEDFLGAIIQAIEEDDDDNDNDIDRPRELGRYVGDWQLYSERGRRDCTITLQDRQAFGNRALSQTFSCQQAYPEFFHVTQWQLRGSDIVLIETGGREKARFSRRDQDTWVTRTGESVFYMRRQGGFDDRWSGRRDSDRRRGGRARFETPTIGGMAGAWNVGEVDGTRECRVTLHEQASFNEYRAQTGVGCSSLIFRISRWNLRGDELVFFATGSSNIVLRMRQTAHNRWEGEADGTRYYMAR